MRVNVCRADTNNTPKFLRRILMTMDAVLLKPTPLLYFSALSGRSSLFKGAPGIYEYVQHMHIPSRVYWVGFYFSVFHFSLINDLQAGLILRWGQSPVPDGLRRLRRTLD